MKRVLLACIVVFVASGCSKEQTGDVLNVDNGRPPVAKTTRCTVPNSDGVRCDVKTCKADARIELATSCAACEGANHLTTMP